MANQKIGQKHKEAQDHYKNASDHAGKAHEHYTKNEQEKGSYHASNAQGYANKGRKATDEAHELHADTHGDKK